MGETNFSGPITVGRKVTSANLGGANAGNVVASQTDTFTHEQVEVNTATSIVIPANAQIVDIIVEVTTAWNSATSDSLEIGTTADPDLFGDVADIQAAGRSTVVEDATQAAARADVGTSDVTISTTVNETGASASAGSANITVLYVQK